MHIIVHLVTNLCFLVEWVIMTIVQGVILHPKSYLRRPEGVFHSTMLLLFLGESVFLLLRQSLTMDHYGDLRMTMVLREVSVYVLLIRSK